jgi:hypothetical protein
MFTAQQVPVNQASLPWLHTCFIAEWQLRLSRFFAGGGLLGCITQALNISSWPSVYYSKVISYSLKD